MTAMTDAARRHSALDHGRSVLSRRELRELGISADVERAQLKARRWQRAGRAVVLHNGPLARDEIEQASRAALRAPLQAPVYDPGAPCTITVELNTADQADPYRNRGDVVVTGPRTIEATADTWWEAWRAIYLTR